MNNNLPRRDFLRNAGIIGIVSLTTNPVFAQTKTNFIPLNGKESFVDKISKKTYNLQTLQNTSLLNIYKTILNNWQNSGYEASGTNYYVCRDESIAIFPLQRHHAVLGLMDSVLLCFGKNKEGDWKSFKSFSGFDLEILAVAIEKLQKQNPDIDLSEYLLPSVNQRVNDGFCFSTPKGEVFIKSILSPNSAETEIIVKEADMILYQQTIVSEHPLAV